MSHSNNIFSALDNCILVGTSIQKSLSDYSEIYAIITYENGCIFEGEIEDGQKNGKGTYTFENGDIYNGEFKNGELNGKGVFTFANGVIYDGEFLNNKLHGKSVITYSNGDKSECNWNNGKKVIHIDFCIHQNKKIK
jgi:hypothetical protein